MLTRWGPSRDFVSLRDAMDRLFNESVLRPWGDWTGGRGTGLTMPLDMYETDGDVVVKASIPGIKPEDIDISVTGDVLTIKGELKEEHETQHENYHVQEHRYGTFQRSVQLPALVNTDQAEAAFENGVLTLTLPKAPEAQPRQIQVKQKEQQTISGQAYAPAGESYTSGDNQ